MYLQILPTARTLRAPCSLRRSNALWGGFGPAFCFPLVVLCFCLCFCLLALGNDLWRRRMANGAVLLSEMLRLPGAKEPRAGSRTKKAGSVWAVRTVARLSVVSGQPESDGPHGQISFVVSTISFHLRC